MVETLPTTSDGIETSVSKTWTPDRGEEIVTRKTGTKAAIDAAYEAEKVAAYWDSSISGLSNNAERGRGTLTITNARTIGTAVDPETGGMQELLGVDVVRPIYAAPYFSVLTAAQIALARTLVDDGATDPTGHFTANATKCYQLFGHLVRGYESYYETAYMFRQTFRTSSGKEVRIAASNQNTVQPLPALSQTLLKLIDTLPDGEWLKRPTECRYVAREGWDVSVEYLWAPEWSIVYGGSFTGGFA
jgi:hypothetical protein